MKATIAHILMIIAGLSLLAVIITSVVQDVGMGEDAMDLSFWIMGTFVVGFILPFVAGLFIYLRIE